MRLAGSLTGFVGDLGLGLTKPMPEVKLLEGETWIGGGFLAAEDGVAFWEGAAEAGLVGVAVAAVFFGATSAGERGAFATLGSRREGLARGLTTEGDFAPALVGGLAAEETGRCAGRGRVSAFASVLGLVGGSRACFVPDLGAVFGANLTFGS